MNETPRVMSVVIEAVSGREEEVASLLSALLQPTHAEAGCLGYELNQSQEKTGVFLFYEKFANQEALDAHVNSAHFQHFLKQREGNDPIAHQTVMRWSPFK
ncbi:MAG: putative quinol monooxygenase [Granulicella sp.]